MRCVLSCVVLAATLSAQYTPPPPSLASSAAVEQTVQGPRPALPVLESFHGIGADLVAGGPSRTASERAGLEAIGEPAGLVGIHDGARPMVSADLIETLFETAARVGGAIPVLEASVPIVDRAEMAPVEDAFVAQTPQVFRGEPLMAAYAAAAVAGYEAQDTAAIARRFAEIDIEAVPGDPGNLKVTIPGDVDLVRTALEPSRTEPR